MCSFLVTTWVISNFTARPKAGTAIICAASEETSKLIAQTQAVNFFLLPRGPDGSDLTWRSHVLCSRPLKVSFVPFIYALLGCGFKSDISDFCADRNLLGIILMPRPVDMIAVVFETCLLGDRLLVLIRSNPKGQAVSAISNRFDVQVKQILA